MASVSDAKDQAREYIKLTKTNVVRTAATVVSKTKGDARPKMKDNVHQVDGNGNLQYYPAPLSCKLIFNGGEDEMDLTSDQFEKLEVGELYMFVGRRGTVKSFGKESLGIVYDSIEEI